MAAVAAQVIAEEFDPREPLNTIARDGVAQTKYLYSDVKKRPRNFVIAVVTIVVVCCFLALLQTCIEKSPVVFIKLSEDQVGEYDLLLTPTIDFTKLSSNNGTNTTSIVSAAASPGGTASPSSNSSGNAAVGDLLGALAPGIANVGEILLNQTWIQQRVGNLSLVTGSAPRWTLLGRLFNRDHPSRNSSLIVLVFDTELEKKIGLGRDWNYRPLGESECYVSSAVLRAIGIRPNRGERVLLGLDFLVSVGALGFQAQFNTFLRDTIRDAVKTQNITLDSSQVNTTELLRQLGINTGPIPLPAPTGNITLQPGAFLSDAAIDAITDSIYDQVAPLLNQSLSASNLQVELTVLDGIDSPQGKWPASLGNVLVLEKRWVPKLLQELLPTNPIVARNILNGFTTAPATSANLTVTINGTTSAVAATQPQTLQQALDGVDISEYALMVAIQYRDRLTTYMKDQNGLNADMIVFTNQVAVALGINYQADFSMPLVQTLETVYYIRLFLDQIFFSVLAILVLLGVMLIYALLLADVEEKTYEYGMLRALGLRHDSLIEMLILQSLYYSLPGFSIGVLLAWAMFVPISYIIAMYSSTPASPFLTVSATLLALGIGFGMPLVANIAPIQRALSKTLRDSLDLYHQTFNETTVTMIKLENLGLSLWQISLSIVLVVIGFVVYYLIPLSFTFQNLPLFFGILNSILLGMVLGTSAVATTLQPLLELGALWLLLWGKERNLGPLIKKSLAGHRNRNRKTALMFTIALAFVIFSGAMFSLQATSLSDNVQAGLGADLVVLSGSYTSPLPESDMRGFLNTQMQAAANGTAAQVVQAFSFVTFPLAQSGIVSQTRLSNLAQFPTYSFMLYGVEQNFLEVIFSRYYMQTEATSQFSYPYTMYSPAVPDTVGSLFVNAGKQLLPVEQNGIVVPPPITTQVNVTVTGAVNNVFYRTLNESYFDYIDIIASEALRFGGSIDTTSPVRLQVGVQVSKFIQTNVIYLAKVRALLKKLPGFFFSSYKQTASFTSALVSMTQYQKLFMDAYYIKRNESARRGQPSTDVAPPVPNKARLMIRLNPNINSTDKDYIIDGLRNFLPDSTTFVIDTQELINSTAVATNLLVLFFNIVAAIAVFLCFFMLWLSFSANVNENAWEFGVLRAIGLSSAQVIRAYIYEATAIIMAAILLGSSIGIFIAITLTLQFNLFTEMPFQFSFPWILFSTVLVMSLAVAVLGSYIPARTLREKHIAQALKGN